ncbi:MAG: ATP-binding protein [Bacteroidetes bacterium]|nr:ATP-binding protein [Bacteroidota bacterium]
MNKVLSKIFRRDLYDRISPDDLMSKQRFVIFRIYSLSGFVASILVSIQEQLTFDNPGILPALLIVLAVTMIINYLAVNDIQKLPLAYWILLIASFLLIHVQAYNTGGVRNSGTIYMSVISLAAFMLLGTRGGKFFTIIIVAHVVFMYVITEYTTWTSYKMFSDNIHEINQDYMITLSVAFILVAAQSSYLHSGKNIIIEKITESRNQLAAKNIQLEEYTRGLEKTNKELDKFASIVSHDLKAPLRAIGNLTGWIEEDAGDTFTPEVKANFDIIKGRVKRMEDLINAILDYSKADRQAAAEEVKFDTKKLIEETVDFIGKPANLTLTLSDQLPTITSDYTRMEQIFSNLINNAIKYTDKDEIKIHIGVEDQKDGWIFSVKDNGPGIDKQYHEKVFVIFQTLNRRDEVESTGVGLAIVKKIIEDQGGKIWVESEPGKGADFRFFWPKFKKQKESALIAATIVV